VTFRNVICLADSVCGTLLSTHTAADTFFLVDREGKEILTYACRTLLVNNVCFVFVSEIFKCGENRVRSCLTQTAE
jgi:hypothetical protein